MTYNFDPDRWYENERRFIEQCRRLEKWEDNSIFSWYDSGRSRVRYKKEITELDPKQNEMARVGTTHRESPRQRFPRGRRTAFAARYNGLVSEGLKRESKSTL
jgi:hypothetical protein